MTKMVVWASSTECYVMAEKDEAEFIKRFWGGEAPDADSKMERKVMFGPIEIPICPKAKSIYENYEC